jgi:hypothetical protein
MVSKVKPITDPDVLAALNAPAPEQQAPTPITDPATLAALSAPPKEKGALERGLSFAGDAAGNAPGDLLDVTKNIAGAIWSPLVTGEKALKTLVGAGINASPSGVGDWFSKHGDPEKVKELIGMADAAGGQLKEEYGSWDKFLETFRKHPVKVLVDLGMVASGTGGVLRGGAKMAGATEGGAAAAGALNKAADVAGKVADYTNPLTPVMKAGTFGLNLGRNALALAKDPRGYLYRNAIGDRGPQVLNTLNAYTETVPGMESTIGQASVGSGAGDLNALSAGILDSSTNARNAALARTQANRAAAEGQVAGVAGTEADLATAQKLRTDTTKPLYTAAEEGAATVDTSKIVNNVADLISKNPGNKYLLTHLETLKNGLLDENGALRTNAAEVISSIDGIKAALKTEKDSHIKGILTDLKDDLIKSVPGYEAANAKYATLSIPIDQMKVAQELQKKLRGPLGNFTPANYNSALLNESNLIKEATGTNRYEKISELFSPETKAKLDAVKDRFILEAEDKRLAQGGEAVEGVKAPKIPWGLSSKVALANKIILALANKINKNVAMDMAADMLDVPRGTAAIKKALENTNPKNLEAPTVRSSSAAIMNNLAPASQNNLGAQQ